MLVNGCNILYSIRKALYLSTPGWIGLARLYHDSSQFALFRLGCNLGDAQERTARHAVASLWGNQASCRLSMVNWFIGSMNRSERLLNGNNDGWLSGFSQSSLMDWLQLYINPSFLIVASHSWLKTKAATMMLSQELDVPLRMAMSG